MTFDDLFQGYERWLDLSGDPDLLRILYGAIVANEFEGNPVWILLVGESGTGKSEMLMSLSGFTEKVYAVSTLTTAAMLSGVDRDESLLHKLNNRILIVKDLSTVTELPPDTRNQIFSMMRDAYDGSVNRHTGRGQIEWSGKFGVLAGATKAIEQARKMESALGERFLTVRMRKVDTTATEQRTVTHKQEMRRDLQRLSARYLTDVLSKLDRGRRTMPKALLERIRSYAGALVRLRSSVSRDHNREIAFPVEITESPNRVMGQLILLAHGMRLLGAPDDEVERGVLRATVESVPYLRMRYLGAIAKGITRPSDIARDMNIGLSYASRTREELDMLEVIHIDPISRKTSIRDPVFGGPQALEILQSLTARQLW